MIVKGTNHVDNLYKLIERWEQPVAVLSRARNIRGSQGHINLEGTPECTTAALLTAADPSFLDAIEDGIEPLVTYLVRDLECITYTSCEGHASDFGAVSSERHVGVAARSDAEMRLLLEWFQKAAAQVSVRGSFEALRIAIHSGSITTDGPDALCVDIVFVPVSKAWKAYIQEANPAMMAFISALEVVSNEPYR